MPLAKPNYAFQKRQRELAKKQKKEEKRQRKAEPEPGEDGTGAAADESHPGALPTPPAQSEAAGDGSKA